MPNDEAALPRFQKPPVSEVAVGVQFPTVLTPVHLGLYYQRIKARFPKYQVLPPVPPAFEIFGAASITPIVSFGVQMPSGLQPRMWFLSQDENSLIQLQSDRLIFNWRGGLRGSPYPHFDAVYEEFVKAFDELGELAETEGIAGIVVNQCEVTYVNPLATANTGVPLSEPERIFRIWTDNRGAEWRQPLEDLSFTARYPLADEGSKPFGRLTVTLSSYGPGPLYSMAPQISPGFQLEMTARGIPKGTGRDGVAAFHDHAHRAIVRCFAAITTPTMHELWERYQ
jgi:uncharacterized protein (TIGR04255 family)